MVKRGAWRAFVGFAAVLLVASSGFDSAASGSPPGSLLWASSFDGHHKDRESQVAVSSDGARVFTTGTTHVGDFSTHFETVAYDADTGSEVWRATYDVQFGLHGTAAGLVVSPDGARVFVTGTAVGLSGHQDYATVAYDASNGSRLWDSRFAGGARLDDRAVAIGISPDGSRVFVTGTSQGASTHEDYATLAYDAANGDELWRDRYNGPSDGADYVFDIVVAPDGAGVIVTGSSPGGRSVLEDYATIAYDPSTGARLWVKRHGSPGGDEARALAVSPDGSRVFVTGYRTTVAYRAATGRRVWSSDNYASHGPAAPTSISVGLSGRRVFVTGYRVRHPGGSDYATVAFAASNGSPRWHARFGTIFRDQAYDVVAGPGSNVLVTGESASSNGYDVVTFDYSARTGAVRWRARYDGAGNGNDAAGSVALGRGGRAFVSGYTTDAGDSQDFLTAAYAF